MNVFAEIGFIQKFELEYSEKLSDVRKMVFSLLTEYPNLKCFLNVNDEDFEKTINDSQVLTLLTDINPRIFSCRNFKNSIIKENAVQTLVFTEEKQEWFDDFKDTSVLCFDYNEFEAKLTDFIANHHFQIDLSDENLKFNWDCFQFLLNGKNVVIMTDPYVLSDKSGQKIKDNILQLLSRNLRKDLKYKIFIITDFKGINIEEKSKIIYSGLAGYNVKIYCINRIRSIENIDFHDRLLYTNYTITAAPSGFNIKTNKLVNSEIITTSIFDKYTYKKYINHIKQIKKYLEKLEQFSDYENTVKVSSSEVFKEFKMLNC